MQHLSSWHNKWYFLWEPGPTIRDRQKRTEGSCFIPPEGYSPRESCTLGRWSEQRPQRSPSGRVGTDESRCKAASPFVSIFQYSSRGAAPAEKDPHQDWHKQANGEGRRSLLCKRTPLDASPCASRRARAWCKVTCTEPRCTPFAMGGLSRMIHEVASCSFRDPLDCRLAGFCLCLSHDLPLVGIDVTLYEVRSCVASR